MVSDTNPRKVHLLREKAITKDLSGASRGDRRAKQEPVDVLDLIIGGHGVGGMLCNLAIRRSETRWDLRSRQGRGIDDAGFRRTFRDGSSQWVKVSECGLGEGGGGVWAEAGSTIRFDRFLQTAKNTILVISHITGGLPGSEGRELWSCNLE
jgi:hypothetical protein